MVPAAALVLALLLGLLSSGTQGWSGQIDALYDTAQIGGQVTSTNGRQATSLAVSTQGPAAVAVGDALPAVGEQGLALLVL